MAACLPEVEGPSDAVRRFPLRLEKKNLRSRSSAVRNSAFSTRWVTRRSRSGRADETGSKSALVLPDIATCPDCLREIFDPGDRRYRYPFTNCTNCGPRFSIIESLPCDRRNTSMKNFADVCAVRTRVPRSERSKVPRASRTLVPIAARAFGCWMPPAACAPGLTQAALTEGAEIIRSGRILALKGTGRVQLIVDARNEAAVLRLRQRKHREEKPFALMAPSLEAVRQECRVSEFEERLLLSPESPIVILERRANDRRACRIPRSPEPVSWIHASLQSAPSFVAAGGRVRGCGHQRQPERRADLHR